MAYVSGGAASANALPGGARHGGWLLVRESGPEPERWAMILAGLGLMVRWPGGALRAGRRASQTRMR